ncbi:MAG: pilus assembly protein N-terminal domain-containing protein [Hyphomicrobiaceae bacterium]
MNSIFKKSGIFNCSLETIVAIVALLAALVTIQPSKVNAADLVVRYDQSQLLRMPRNVADVIIGNPSIADVSVQRGNLLVITGKTFGITNIIALDDERNVIHDQRVVVQRDERRVVNLHKGSQRESFTCSPNCNPTITIGDGSDYFDMITKHSASKTSFSANAGVGDSSGN